MIRVRLRNNAPDPRVITIALDSGAFSWSKFYARSMGGDRRKHDFADTVEFRKYLNSYITFLNSYKEWFDFYVNLDVIGNAKRTHDVQMEMESHGLSPIPVFHLGSDMKYFKKYAENHPIIGVSISTDAFAKNKRATYAGFNRLFSYFTDKKTGKPSIKCHGFALTSVDFMVRWPWWSVDSSSWATSARYGGVVIPSALPAPKGVFKPDWLAVPQRINVTDRTLNNNVHIKRRGGSFSGLFEEYLSNTFGEDCLALLDDYHMRDVINAVYYVNTGLAIKKHYRKKYNFGEGGNLYLGARTSEALITEIVADFLLKTIRLSDGDNPFKYFGTFFYKRDLNDMIKGALLAGERLNHGEKL